ncbi:MULTISPECIES: TfoX/Sxy family protein [Glutamicibacter]|uniref:TfoX/Sxy family protein n=1 Tax=Glutamicibacter halophytocola TaxID=1933880 RepID=A0A5B8IKG5_9MICC|nr:MULTISPECIES: TfoX/Sxy family protein [Glutamicibacter]QDY65181.1 TfoX/Sxy family protein [Glutamicibacter halophytocola]UUX60505.1 TfoX/Sxy family protein [Glutamicibacter halophytocola]
MTPQQSQVVARLRSMLAAEPAAREVSMFGGRSLMVNEKMLVSVHKDGGLLVRVECGQHEEVLGWPGASQAEMGRGRIMGQGWIQVAAEAIVTDDQLAIWIRAAMDHNCKATGADQ